MNEFWRKQGCRRIREHAWRVSASRACRGYVCQRGAAATQDAQTHETTDACAGGCVGTGTPSDAAADAAADEAEEDTQTHEATDAGADACVGNGASVGIGTPSDAAADATADEAEEDAQTHEATYAGAAGRERGRERCGRCRRRIGECIGWDDDVQTGWLPG